MTQKEADQKAKEIYEEYKLQCDEIEKQAKENGEWKTGLDANSHLFHKLWKETAEKLKEIEAGVVV